MEDYFSYYNTERLHSALDYKPPVTVHFPLSGAQPPAPPAPAFGDRAEPFSLVGTVSRVIGKEKTIEEKKGFMQRSV